MSIKLFFTEIYIPLTDSFLQIPRQKRSQKTYPKRGTFAELSHPAIDTSVVSFNTYYPLIDFLHTPPYPML